MVIAFGHAPAELRWECMTLLGPSAMMAVLAAPQGAVFFAQNRTPRSKCHAQVLWHAVKNRQGIAAQAQHSGRRRAEVG